MSDTRCDMLSLSRRGCFSCCSTPRIRFFRCGVLALLISFSARLNYAATISISVSEDVPGNASDIVSHTFQSWACAVHSWPDCGGNHSEPNIFSKSLLGIISNKTGSPPHFRVGGTSGDRTTFHANQTAAIKYDTLPGTQIPENVTIGPAFYEAFDTFVDLETRYIYMVTLPLGIHNALAEARCAVETIGSYLEGLEIGNEVDLYIGQGVKPRNWTEVDYVHEWQAIARPITEQILVGNNYSIDPGFIWQALAFSSANPGAGFTLGKAFRDGIDRYHNIKSVSVHSYMTGYTPATTLQASFMNHTNIVGNVSLWLPWKNYLAEHEPNVPLYIAEANSDPVTNTLPITYELQGVFGSALWKVDILMYAMSVGVPRYYVQQGTGFAFDSWQPVYINDTAPKVLPPWYGDTFVADVIGTAPDVQVSNIDLGSDVISAYSVYTSGALAKYVIVNLEEWNTTTSYPRPLETVLLTVPDYVTAASARYLIAPGANVMTDIKWAGQSWNYSSSAVGQVEVTGSLQCVEVSPRDGIVEVALKASEAVLVTLERTQLVGQC